MRPLPAAAAGTPVGFGFGGAVRALLFVDQRLPVGDGDLVIVRMDFAERQKSVAIAAVLDERRLQRRFDTCDLGEMDVAAKLLAVN